MGKVFNQEGFVLSQDLGLASAQDELVKRHFHFFDPDDFLVLFKIAS